MQEHSNDNERNPLHDEELIDARTALRDPRLLQISRRGGGLKNRPRHELQFWRWAVKGLVAPDGKTRVKLETVRTPWGRKTSRQAIGRFISAVCGNSFAITVSQRGRGLNRQHVLNRKLDASGIPA